MLTAAVCKLSVKLRFDIWPHVQPGVLPNVGLPLTSSVTTSADGSDHNKHSLDD